MHPVIMDMVVQSITDERRRAAERHRRMARAAVYVRRPRRRLRRRLREAIPLLRRRGRSPGAATVPGGAEAC